MKKIYLTILVCLLTGSTFAQTKFGIKAGVNFAKMAFSGDDAEDFDEGLKAQTSFQIGGYADLAVGKSFSIQPGLTLSGKGFKFDESEGSATYKEQINIMYLEIPVNAVYKIGGIYLGAGPYAAFALSGKNKAELKGAGEDDFEDEEDLKFGSDDEDNFKSTDFGINLLAGYQLSNGVNLGVNYGLGLSNISPTSEGSDFKAKNRVFSITVGFSF